MVVVRDVRKADEEDRRQKRIIVTLFSIGIFGLSYLVYDYMQIIDRATIPEDLNQIDPIVAQWRADGLVESFDVMQAQLVVNERKWLDRKKEEKIGIVTQLARYCAERNQNRTWELTVFAKGTSMVLGEMGRRGLVIQ
ncbi:MAG: hypothetical protein HYW57_09180 [Ignavibacteriales bacterium]|nr:hypothetical protein [Ignavibacteriales bacterium]